MAQRSKKDFIVETALPLFLQHGFKGTSIDLVVKTCGVSKPTVYNHFPDKAALMLAVIDYWLALANPCPVISDLESLDDFIQNQWLTTNTVSLYALIIGEGGRFDDAKRIFWDRFDRSWRDAIIDSVTACGLLERYQIELMLDQQLLQRLKQR